MLDAAFLEYHPGGELEEGKNLLLVHMARRTLRNFLDQEKETLKKAAKDNQLLTLLGLETTLEAELRGVNIGNDYQGPVKIYGKADRIDRLGNLLRIIDYKTGRVEKANLKFKQWEELLTDVNKSQSLQLLTYAWLYSQNHLEEQNLEAGIFSLRTPGQGLLTVECPGNTKVMEDDNLKQFEDLLCNLVEEIMDISKPFEQTGNTDNCKYCPFVGVCHRW